MQNTEEKRSKIYRKIILIIFAVLFITFSVLADWDSVYSLFALKADTKNKLSVSFISVGDADCAYIHIADTDILIDCGTEISSDKVISFLKRYDCKSLDAIFLSHPDSDHIGGAESIIKEFAVEKIYCYNTPASLIGSQRSFAQLDNSISENNIDKEFVNSGDVLSYGDLKFKVISPKHDYDNSNDCSLVLKLIYKEKSFLFTGDISNAVEEELVQSCEDISADVLKIAHHGSAYSSSEEFLKRVSPQISVISAGTDDLYLPDYKTEYRISELSRLYITGNVGDVVITTDGGSLEAQTGV